MQKKKKTKSKNRVAPGSGDGQMSIRQQEKIDWYKQQRDAMLTAIPQAGTLRKELRPSRQMRFPTGLEAEDEKAGASTIILPQREQKLPCAKGGQLGHRKDGHHCLAKVKRVNWSGGSSKLVGELCTVICVFGSCTPVNLNPPCDSSESISHNLRP